MSLPNRSTKLKVAFGYILLTALLFISIGYIYQEMKSLSGTGDDEAILSQRRHVTNQIISQLYQAEVIGQSLSTGQIEQYYRYQRAMKQATTALDSLRTLLTDSIQLARLDTVGMLFMDKERNMRNLLKAIQDGGTDILYKQHIDELIAQQDSLLSLPHVRKKVITHTNSYIIRKKPKSFFKRLGEVFSPGKADSTQVNNVIQEEYTDTLTEAYSPADTVVTMLKNIQSRVTDTQQERMEMVNRRTQSLRLSGLKLSQKVKSAIKYYRGRRASFGPKQTYTRGIYSPKLYPHSGGNRHCRCGSGYFLSGLDMERHHSQQPLPPRTGKSQTSRRRLIGGA